MRAWIDIYDANDTKQGTLYNIVSVSKKSALDGAGSISFSTSGMDADALSLLVNERRCKMHVEHDGVTRNFGNGVVRKIKKSANASGYGLTVGGPDNLDALNRKSVLLGRAYTDTPISTIASNLISLVSGWTVSVDSGLGNQTARYDGVSVLKALIRTATEKGLHIREGSTANTLELGAFGDDNGVWAVAPQTMSRELMTNDNIVIVDSITQETDSQDVVNWAVILGAGEGAAALTLNGATSIGPYTVNTMTGPDGGTIAYIKDDTSIALYGQNEKIVSFKEIGPVSNSDTAKLFAKNALLDAGSAWLQRNKDPLITYKVTVRKPRTNIRPGDKMRLTYKGFVETRGEDLVPINVDSLFWVMEVTETISDSGDTLSLTLATIDRVAKDATKIVVDALESVTARNVSVNTFATTFTYVYTDTIGWNGSSKSGSFRLKFKDYVTDVISVRLSFRTFPLEASTIAVNLTPFQYNWALKQSYNYPSDITLSIDGVDRSAALGAPSGAWNFGGVNAALDVSDLDVTQYIVGAVGGIYQIHTFNFDAGTRTGEVRYDTSYPSVTQSTASAGKIECVIEVLCTARATIPALS